MSSTKTLVALGSSAALLLMTPAFAIAQPVSPPPVDGVQAPGLPAVQGLAPVIQDAASDPTNATSMLMAAAAMFTGDAEASPESRNVAAAVNDFVSKPATPVAHKPAAGAVPGAHAHLPPGVNPAHAVGPLPAHAPEVPQAPGPAPGPAPEAAVPGAAAPDAAASAPEAAPVTEAAAPVPEALSAVEPPAPAPSPEASGPNTAPPGFAPDSPPTQEFMYPSISNGCLADGGNVLATAISVAGPADIPTPGPGPGQTAYVFTAVGTPGPAPEQKLPLNVTWVNLTTGKSGTATLKPRPDINPDGPTTLTAIVDTGSGSIMSTIFGQVTTVDKQCQFMPTIGSTVVP